MDYAYFKHNFRLIALDSNKQKALDSDPRAIQKTVFQGVVGGDHNTKETVLGFYKGTEKVQ